jgi:ABC-2 type transport system ATP-binding protein
MEHVLEIKDLVKEYGQSRLDNINLKIPCGRTVGLIGENGAGKTTLISLILNQIKGIAGRY